MTRPMRPGALLALLTAVGMLSYIDRQLLSAFVIDIRRDLGLSYFEFTLLSGLVFSLFYTVAGVPAGLLADRGDRPRLIAWAIGLWSVLTAATGAAASFVQVALIRAGIGVGEAVLTPAAVSILSDAFPAPRRGMAISIFYLGIPLGGGGSLVLAGLLGPLIGWRGCFALLGGVGLLAALLLIRVGDPGRLVPSHPRPASSTLRDALALIRTSRTIGYLLIGSVATFFSLGAVVLDQAWLVAERGFSPRDGQLVFGLLFLAAGMVGTLCGGWLSDRAGRRGAHGRLACLSALSMAFVAASLAFRCAPAGSALFYLGAALSYALFMAPVGTIMATLSELAPAHVKATLVGVGIVVMSVLGNAGGNAAAGWLSDAFVASGIAAPLTTALLCVNLVSVFAAVLFALSAQACRKGRTDRDRRATTVVDRV